MGTCNGNGNCSAANQCNCTTGFAGPNCDLCDDYYAGYPNCVCTYSSLSIMF